MKIHDRKLDQINIRSLGIFSGQNFLRIREGKNLPQLQLRTDEGPLTQPEQREVFESSVERNAIHLQANK